MRYLTILPLLTLLMPLSPAQAQRILFDASHGQTAGNADWIIDADSSQQAWQNYRCQPGGEHHSAQQFPTPPQSEITVETPETFWEGGISAWGVALAKDNLNPERKQDWQIEQYPWNAAPFSYKKPDNPQDLSHYDVLVLNEPNVLYSDAEAEAIRQFVFEGGGLFLIADHETSDRNCSSGDINAKHDSPYILNRLMRTAVKTQPQPRFYNANDKANYYGLYGIWFYENGNDDPKDQQNRAFDWFDEPNNNNVSGDPNDPIIHGPFGDGSNGLGLFGATQIAISTHSQQGNSAASAHIWRNSQDAQPNLIGVSEGVTLASSRYGKGRVVALGDSSPTDDSTGEGQLYPGWNLVPNVANSTLILNATDWLARSEPRPEPPKPEPASPQISAGPAVSLSDCVATLNWQTNQKTITVINWGEGDQFDRKAAQAGMRSNHLLTLGGLSPDQHYSYRIEMPSEAESISGQFTIPPRRAIAFSQQPSVVSISETAVQLQWSANQAILSSIDYGKNSLTDHHLTLGEERQRQQIELSNLTPATDYSLRVILANACGETLTSDPIGFTTAAPKAEAIDLSGWHLINDQSRSHFVFPAGTVLRPGEHLVLGRDNERTEFVKSWPQLPAASHYLNAHNSLVINKTTRRYNLVDLDGNLLPSASAVSNEGESVYAAGCTNGKPTWANRKQESSDPGQGGKSCNSGLRINEVSDANNYRDEFVEIFYDAQ